MATSDEVISPRIRRLRAALAAGDAAALPAFWSEMEEQGAPLIEPGAGEELLVTLVWRARAPTRNVVVIGGLECGWSLWDLPRHQMTALPGTDLWFKTYRLRRGLRTTYRLSPNDALLPAEAVQDWAQRTATWQPDPLNPHQWPTDPISRAVVPIHSVLELPGAPPQPWLQPVPGRPSGTVTEHRLVSSRLGNARSVWVYTPPGYAEVADGEVTRPDLLLLFDGWANLHLIPTPTILDNLLAAGRLPPLVAVLIGSPDQATRDQELTCSPAFTTFLVQELLPWLQAHYRVTTDPRRTVIGGASFGGLAATFAALQAPAVFGNVLSQSAPFGWKPADEPEAEWLRRQVVQLPPRPVRFHLSVGRLEIGGPTAETESVAATRRLRAALAAKGYAVQYEEYEGGHDCLCWRGTLADGLLRLLGPTTSQQSGN